MNDIEIRKIKQSEKSAVFLVENEDGKKLVKKVLKGKHKVFEQLKELPHQYLPMIEEVILQENETIIYEEYIEGATVANVKMTEKQLLLVTRELLEVLKYLHSHQIIHRDIKPSNILLAEDGHIRLIDFDAARTVKADSEQDTDLLGTKGFAPPEQYGFAQTDERTDIYALGVTLKQLYGENECLDKKNYQKIIQKCMNLSPADRYQNVKEIEKAFKGDHRLLRIACSLLILCCVGIGGFFLLHQTDSGKLKAPANPHWQGESGKIVFGDVPEADREDDFESNWYTYRVYRMDTETLPDLETTDYFYEGGVTGTFAMDPDTGMFSESFGDNFLENGYYYFAVRANGDGETTKNSDFVLSDAFSFTGEDAPSLPRPTNLKWKIVDSQKNGPQYYATWENLSEYDVNDSFNVIIYDENGMLIGNNVWSKAQIMSIGRDGIWISEMFLSDKSVKYHFVVEVYTGRPNQYSSWHAPYDLTEEDFSDYLKLE